jgi:Arc/MetJ-type ribon-helix-helix transcriptional regulator
MPPELEAAIDAWIEGQPEPKPSRSEAIRRLIELGLKQR